MLLTIVVLGAGLGGLAVALSVKQESSDHDVLVVESAPVLTELSCSKPSLEKLATSPQEFLVRRYDGCKLLGERQNFAAEMLAMYGSYYWDMHRADLQLALFDRVESLGVRFQFGTLVTDVDPSIPQLITDKGERITGDLVIAADGLWSKARSAVLGRPSPPINTGDLAYRIVLKSEDIKDRELLDFMKKPRIVNFPQCDRQLINPRLQKFLSQVDKVEKWKLMHLDELEKWYNEEATVVFLGDACHPMLPYMAQGAGSALEDGAALGILLSKVQSREELPKALKIYQGLRAPRSTALQKWSMKQRHTNHLPDGPEQEARDQLAVSQLYDQQPGYPFYWIDPAAQALVYGYDVIAELGKIGVEPAMQTSA
ncbi:hypothetical protein SAPIO_CDS2207 [Scedosporium apiospermum]|uniref:FAD-binding domain-containing protein n=1 Tax=Pseudallescheria apiosperma TaxID=563466 RepID=A0A084GDG4_PSEDA|nr:uncharacterized protein SAPIO_CDS2207 [Scedosporium apiospermum]KEZ45376.1 hypothetical protein SAPIO_CDS2207 [Scedosporium apiospermum]